MEARTNITEDTAGDIRVRAENAETRYERNPRERHARITEGEKLAEGSEQVTIGGFVLQKHIG